LHEEIEIQNVASENDTPISGCGEEDQRIIERLALLVLAVLLKPRQESSEDSGFAPCIPIGCENAMLRPQIDRCSDLGNHIGCVRMRRVEETGECRELCFSNRRVPKARGAESNIYIAREPCLQSVDIDSGVEDQFRERWSEAR